MPCHPSLKTTKAAIRPEVQKKWSQPLQNLQAGHLKMLSDEQKIKKNSKISGVGRYPPNPLTVKDQGVVGRVYFFDTKYRY